jgi:hypothetical protein
MTCEVASYERIVCEYWGLLFIEESLFLFLCQDFVLGHERMVGNVYEQVGLGEFFKFPCACHSANNLQKNMLIYGRGRKNAALTLVTLRAEGVIATGNTMIPRCICFSSRICRNLYAWMHIR